MGTPDIIASFTARLQTDWKRESFSGRYFYATHQIVEWMRTCDSSDSISNASLLLAATDSEGFDCLQGQDVTSEDKPLMLILCILIILRQGRLLRIFYNHDVTDHNLDLDVAANAELVKELESVGLEDYKAILDEFETAKWPFCTRRLKFRMGEKFDGGNWILPFCRRSQITEGGTAVIYEAIIQEDLVDDGFREAVWKSRHTRKGLGVCYHVAIKSYSEAWLEAFAQEVKAFQEIQEVDGVVQFLGYFGYEEQRPGSGVLRQSWNIILEYGELDLMEFFADPQQHPPIFTGEIMLFWRSFSKVAAAIDRIHNLEYVTADKDKTRYNGWHADIKPQNILRVHGEFKLADFGFARFMKASHDLGEAPQIHIDGGTKTYGAPEQYRNQNKRQSTKTPVTQAIDIWSFGCVLSVIASWVTLGFQGVTLYENLRSDAHSQLNKDRDVDNKDNVGSFHDGTSVLESVTQWHHFLRNHLRRSDTTTAQILDLIDNFLLKAAPEERLSAAEMLARLNRIVEEGDQSKALELVPPNILDSLLTRNRDAPADVLENINFGVAKRPELRGPVHEPGKAVRIGRAERINPPPGQVAHRREVLEQLELQRLELDVWKRRPPVISREEPGSMDFPRSPVQTPPTSAGGLSVTQPRSAPSHVMPILPLQDVHNMDPDAEKTYTGPLLPTALDSGDQAPRGPPRTAQLTGLQISTSPPGLSEGHMSETLAPRPEYIQPDKDEDWEPFREVISEMYRTMKLEDVMEEMERNHNFKATARQYKGIIRAWGLGIQDLSRSPYSWRYPDLPIWQEHQEQLKRREGFFKKMSMQKDGNLKLFINKRDIVFVVDNDSTMAMHWQWAKFVLHTLAMKLEKIDEDGMDLHFTIGQVTARNTRKSETFRRLMDDAQPRDDNLITDMTHALSARFDEYLKNPWKPTTVVVLTDGNWGGKSITLIARIADFIKTLQQRIGTMKDRWFTIQFITFGDDKTALDRLRALEEDLSKDHGIVDIIDAKSMLDPVDSMILGSINAAYESDGDFAPSALMRPPVLHDAPTAAPTVRQGQYGAPLFESPKSEDDWSQQRSTSKKKKALDKIFGR